MKTVLFIWQIDARQTFANDLHLKADQFISDHDDSEVTVSNAAIIQYWYILICNFKCCDVIAAFVGNRTSLEAE